jgi:carbamoyltransferase
MFSVRDGIIQSAHRQHEIQAQLKRIQWRCTNEQFAYMAQRTVESVCVALAKQAVQQTGISRLAISGGVASNIKATQLIRNDSEITDVYVFPHMGDGGLAYGSAVSAALEHENSAPAELTRLDLGPDYDKDAIVGALRLAGLPVNHIEDLATETAERLLNEQIVLWFQGRMEYGPRALGQRSALARADRPALRNRLNGVLKRRSFYQPFCPSLLESDAEQVLLDWSGPSNRFMTTAYTVKPEFQEQLSGVIASDGSCRPHVIEQNNPSVFASMLRVMHERTGIGAILNTSFNIHGEPIVCTPTEAIDVYLRSAADALAIGPYFVAKDNDL